MSITSPRLGSSTVLPYRDLLPESKDLPSVTGTGPAPSRGKVFRRGAGGEAAGPRTFEKTVDLKIAANPPREVARMKMLRQIRISGGKAAEKSVGGPNGMSVEDSVSNMHGMADRAYRNGIITKADLTRLRGGESWPSVRGPDQAFRELTRLLQTLEPMFQSAQQAVRARFPTEVTEGGLHPAVAVPGVAGGASKARWLLTPAGVVTAAGVAIAMLAPPPKTADDTLSGAIRKNGPAIKQWAIGTLKATAVDNDNNRQRKSEAINWMRALANPKLYPKGVHPLVTKKELATYEAMTKPTSAPTPGGFGHQAGGQEE